MNLWEPSTTRVITTCSTRWRTASSSHAYSTSESVCCVPYYAVQNNGIVNLDVKIFTWYNRWWNVLLILSVTPANQVKLPALWVITELACGTCTVLLSSYLKHGFSESSSVSSWRSRTCFFKRIQCLKRFFRKKDSLLWSWSFWISCEKEIRHMARLREGSEHLLSI